MKKIKSQKGITLIALVVTIIVLIILAGVSINLLFGDNGILQKAKDAEEVQKVAETKEQIQLALAEKQIETKGALSYTDIEAVLSTFGTVNKEENTVVSVTTTGGYVIPVTDVYKGTITSANTYTEYTMGDVVTLGGEDFYVIENSDSNTATVKLLAKLNVITTEGNENKYKQDASANTLRFDDDSNVYYDDTTNPVTQAEIKTHVDNYKTAVEGRMGAGKKIQEARLMTGTAEGTWNENYTVWNYTSGTGEVGTLIEANKTDIVYGTNYWLGSAYVVYSYYSVQNNLVNLINSTGNDNINNDSACGLRPVFVILKSNI